MDFNEKGKLGEDFVTNLASERFVRYWCYPNPKHENGDKKEICDLLIHFGNIVLVISVKSIFLHGNYDRYLKKVVKKSSNQLFGAERKLTRNVIQVRHPDRGIEQLDINDNSELFLITVNTGEQFENYELYDKSTGNKHVSIFNKETFEFIMSELDTIKDFTQYLKEREKLLSINGLEINGSEKDLLSIFLRTARQFPQHFYQENATLNVSGDWEALKNDRKVILKKMHNRSSYFIDRMVRKDVLKINNGEILGRELMSLNRLDRRLIAKSLFELVDKYEGQEEFLGRRFIAMDEVPFLLIYYHSNQMSSDEIDQNLLLTSQLYQYKKGCNKIIYIGMTSGFNQWKFGMMIRDDDFSMDEKQRMDLTIQRFGWFQNEIASPVNEQEYPED